MFSQYYFLALCIAFLAIGMIARIYCGREGFPLTLVSFAFCCLMGILMFEPDPDSDVQQLFNGLTLFQSTIIPSTLFTLGSFAGWAQIRLYEKSKELDKELEQLKNSKA